MPLVCLVVAGTLAVACVGLPWMLLLLLPLASVYWHVQRRYRPTSRQLKRLAAATLSPVYSHFSETLAGLAVVRSARSAPPFRRRHHHLVEENLKTQFAAQAASQVTPTARVETQPKPLPTTGRPPEADVDVQRLADSGFDPQLSVAVLWSTWFFRTRFNLRF